jgi:general secretion pathway protein E
MHGIGELLLQHRLVSERDLADAAAVCRSYGGRLGPTLVRLGAVSEADLLAALSEQLHLPIIDQSALPSPEAVRAAAERLRVPLAWLVDHELVPWFEPSGHGEQLSVAGRHIDSAAVQEAIEQWHDAPARLFLAHAQALEPLFAELGAELGEATPRASDPSRLRELAEEAPAIDFVNAMLAAATERRASDVHIEPFEDRMAVRLRIDGILTQWRTAPRTVFDAVASRIKLLSGMDIAERRLPQDGRQSIRVAGREIDVRVSTLPTTWGESVVLRFLGKTKDLPTLSELGLADDYAQLLHRMIAKPNGVVLVTGPTGSGKTTTVYRLLAHLNDGIRKIVTVEDPVEIDLPGVLQTHVRAEIGLDFAAGLRSILRQDPDVIFVGEIRDPETAKIAVQAALTGHLVISTVHTNSAPAAVARLLDLGVEEYLLAEVLRGLVGQRLLRRNCAACSRPQDEPSAEARARAQLPDTLLLPAPQWRSGAGCARCGHSGYAGRVGVFEIAEVDPALQLAIRRRADEADLVSLLRRRGFRSMYEDALMKARAGETTLAEALRVVSP